MPHMGFGGRSLASPPELRDGALRRVVRLVQLSLKALCLGLLSPALLLPAQSPEPWQAPASAKQLENPLKTDGKTVERGRRLYRHYCLPCHGEAGVGDGAMAKRLGYKPANLTLERLNSQVDGEIFWKVSNGKAPMPEFQKELSDRDRWDIVSFVRTLLKQGQ